MKWVWMAVVCGVMAGAVSNQVYAAQPQEASQQAAAEAAAMAVAPAAKMVMVPQRVQYATVPTYMLVTSRPATATVTTIVYSPRMAREIRKYRALSRELDYLERRTERTRERVESMATPVPVIYAVPQIVD